MKTITIEDPTEVLAAMKAEWPSLSPHDLSASFTDRGEWSLYIWMSGSNSISGRGKSATEALGKLRENYVNNDPAKKIRDEAAKLGLKLVPA